MSLVQHARPDDAAETAAALTLLKRPLPPAFAAWLGALPGECWPDGRFLAHVRDVRAGVLELFDQCETPLGEIADWWAGDVAALAAQFAEIAGDEVLDVRLERVTDNACAKFHRDHVPVRLVATYFGPRTELIPAEFGPEALAAQRDYAGPVERLNASDIAIFHGGPGGVVHRSPQIANTGAARAMLCLNTRFSASPDLWTPADITTEGRRA